MSKAEWSRTCRRIENRLQNLKVENMDVDVSGPKPREAVSGARESGEARRAKPAAPRPS
jgi:hypothetical protein